MGKYTLGVCFALLLMTMTTGTEAAQCKLELSVSQSVVKSDQKQKICVKAGVTGFEIKSEKAKSRLNIAIVLDRSGSMGGEKIRQAKDAAICAVERMSVDDIVSVVTYSSEVEVLVPATKLRDKKEIIQKIRDLRAGGMTALHAGTEAGIREVKKNFDKEWVNRVILLSDGLANVGPDAPQDLQKLGREAGVKGIAITTFGLGENFNEELMIKLAGASDGNHVFITKASNLVEVFSDEFDITAKIVAQKVKGKLVFDRKVKILRSLNMEIEKEGHEVAFTWNQLYGGHERYLALEVEIPAGEEGESLKLATAKVSYLNMETKETDELSAVVKISYSDSDSKIKDAVNKGVMEDYTLQIANLANEEATRLRDRGDVRGAQNLLNSNAGFLRRQSSVYGGSVKLDQAAQLNEQQAGGMNASDADWVGSRKQMRAHQEGNRALSPTVPVK